MVCVVTVLPPGHSSLELMNDWGNEPTGVESVSSLIQILLPVGLSIMVGLVEEKFQGLWKSDRWVLKISLYEFFTQKFHTLGLGLLLFPGLKTASILKNLDTLHNKPCSNFHISKFNSVLSMSCEWRNNTEDVP